jgi:esterase/lipase superfamily enzyme
VIASGSSIGAYEALATTLRHPDLFESAICLSGTYDLSKFLEGPETDTLRRVSPLHFVPGMGGEQLETMRERSVLLAHGTGRWEEPAQSWRVAQALGEQGIPNRVDEWGEEWDHDWPTWRKMLPQYLEELLPGAE